MQEDDVDEYLQLVRIQTCNCMVVSSGGGSAGIEPSVCRPRDVKRRTGVTGGLAKWEPNSTQ